MAMSRNLLHYVIQYLEVNLLKSFFLFNIFAKETSDKYFLNLISLQDIIQNLWLLLFIHANVHKKFSKVRNTAKGHHMSL